MLLTIPIYVEVRRAGGAQVHRCRPLFFAGPRAEDAHLGLAIGKLNRRLRQHFDRLGGDRRHDELAAQAYSPELSTHLLKHSLELRKGQFRCRLLWVAFAALGRRVAFTPSLPELWLEVNDGEKLQVRAEEVLTHHLRDLEKAERHSGGGRRPEAIGLEGQAWVTTVDLDIRLRQQDQKKTERKLAALFDDERSDGGLELQRVGRCLDWLYPDELAAAIARDAEAAQLSRLLEVDDNRPVAIVGPRLVGKTAVVQECVRLRAARRGRPYSARNNVWLLSPQRLISGMMYVGQWEGRLEAILREARRRRHVLYFDDFLGLYRAGISRDANLSVADVLKPYVLRREVRVLAEMTVEGWQAFQERDRGLSDQFHVMRIAPTSEEATIRVMLEVHRQLEDAHGVRFDVAALPAVVQLQQSYVRDAAFPGKAAAFSRQLAQKRVRQTVGVDDVRLEFSQRTGLAMDLLDENSPLTREGVVARLRRTIVGQDEAVEAAADVVAVAKARLNDPARPLTTLLFLGPTGVGKTQTAKALAEVMFSGGRLLRFDMNEYGGPLSAAQLGGTFSQPDGLLTSAVRSQPFAVVLLDEIEKAHPDVFDLLLQVTGEGRLTDALGRTADFSNTVIVMTSNLGTAAGRGQIGLAPAGSTGQHGYVKAAENFFRPEFFNRIDRVIPFDTLTREQMRSIADLLLADLFRRDGLVRRRCALAVEAGAMQQIVEAGYHPQFGARALKRAIERQLVQPVAASLACVKPEVPTVIGVYPQPQGVTAAVHPLESVAPVAASGIGEREPAEQLERVRGFLQRMDDEIETARPAALSTGDGVSPPQMRYYALREQIHRVRELATILREAVYWARGGPAKPEISPRTPAEKLVIRDSGRIPSRRFLKDIQAAQDIRDYLHEAAAVAPHPGELENRLTALRHESALLHALWTSAGSPDRALVLVRPVDRLGDRGEEHLCAGILAVLELLGYACERSALTSLCGAPQALLASGPGIWPLVLAEAGTHLFCRQHEELRPQQVCVFQASDESLENQLAGLCACREAWLVDMAAGRAQVADDPWPLGPIVRFYEAAATLDVRTGLTVPHFPAAADWKTLLLAGLPLPPELRV